MVIIIIITFSISFHFRLFFPASFLFLMAVGGGGGGMIKNLLSVFSIIWKSSCLKSEDDADNFSFGFQRPFIPWFWAAFLRLPSGDMRLSEPFSYQRLQSSPLDGQFPKKDTLLELVCWSLQFLSSLILCEADTCCRQTLSTSVGQQCSVSGCLSNLRDWNVRRSSVENANYPEIEIWT